jgi:hypothetical protein
MSVKIKLTIHDSSNHITLDNPNTFETLEAFEKLMRGLTGNEYAIDEYLITRANEIDAKNQN